MSSKTACPFEFDTLSPHHRGEPKQSSPSVFQSFIPFPICRSEQVAREHGLTRILAGQ